MARNRVKLGSLTKQIQDNLDKKLAISVSKDLDKQLGRELNGDSRSITMGKIYSWESYRTDMKNANYFARYCKENYNCRTIDQCRPYVNEWIQKQIDDGLSPSTQKTRANALAKLYGCSTKDFIKTQVRHRRDITRSRGVKVRDKHFSEKKNADLVSFCRSTGLRRAELKALTGDKLVYKASEDKYYIKVNSGSKGGRPRLAPIIGDVKSVVEKMNNAGSEKVFKKVLQGADIHSYRADYATSFYKEIAKPVEELNCNLGVKGGNTGDAYVCRGELKGVIYDRGAMKVVSEALGHNRISVIASNYLRSNEIISEEEEAA